MTSSAVASREAQPRPAKSLDELGVEQRTTAEGRLYVLPEREPQRAAGTCLIVFGLVFGGIPGTMLVKGLIDVLAGSGSVFELIFTLFTLPFVLAGFALAALGQGLFGGRTELELTSRELRVRERLGLASWRSNRPLADWRRTVLATKDASLRGRTLRLEFEGHRPLFIAPGYPPPIVCALATELARVADDARIPAAFELPPARAEVERPERRPEDAEQELAPDTDLEVERRGAAILVHVPPSGLWKGSRGLLLMGLFFIASVAVFLAITVVQPMMSRGLRAEQVPFLLGGLLFGTIGGALLVGGWNMGRRKATLAATSEKLVVERISIFGTKRGEWTRAELDDVRIGRSGMEINGVPVMELQVLADGSKAMGLLSQRTDREIRWLARELRRALCL